MKQEVIECFEKLEKYCEEEPGFIQNYFKVLLGLIKWEIQYKDRNKRSSSFYQGMCEKWLECMTFCEYMTEMCYMNWKDGLDEWLLEMEKQIRAGTSEKRKYTKK